MTTANECDQEITTLLTIDEILGTLDANKKGLLRKLKEIEKRVKSYNITIDYDLKTNRVEILQGDKSFKRINLRPANIKTWPAYERKVWAYLIELITADDNREPILISDDFHF